MKTLPWIHLIVVMHFVQIITASDGKFYQVLLFYKIHEGARSAAGIL